MRYIAFVLSFYAVFSLAGVNAFAQNGVKGNSADSSQRQDVQNNEPVYAPKEVDTKAIITYKPEPVITAEAMKNGVFGEVVLEVILSSSGRLDDIKVIKKLPYGLTDTAIKAVRKVKFTPAIKDGHPVSIRVKFVYNFNTSGKIYWGDRSKLVYYEEGCADYANIALKDQIYFYSSKEAKEAGYKKAKSKCP